MNGAPALHFTTFTAAELMAAEFTPDTADEFRAVLMRLVDSGECHPLCLFADPIKERTCDCVCEGLHHGRMRLVIE